MERDTVNSSSLTSVGYDVATETLEVEFHGGRIYQYYNVPQFTYETLMQQSSIGSFFNANIKDNFPNARL
jgi:hypothetical protein